MPDWEADVSAKLAAAEAQALNTMPQKGAMLGGPVRAGSATFTRDVNVPQAYPLSAKLAQNMQEQAAITEATLNTIMEAHHRHFGPAAPYGETSAGNSLRGDVAETTEGALLGEQRRQTERLATLAHLVQSLVSRL